MGAWDTCWMRAIDPAVSGLRAERTSRLPARDNQCQFAVLETGDPLVSYTSKIAQRFAGEQDPGDSFAARSGCSRSAQRPG